MSKTKILLSGLFLAILTVGNAYSRNMNTVPSLLISPVSNISSEYQVAGVTFLPDLNGSETGWAGNNIGGGHNRNDCSAYPLSSCPSGGNCSKCPFAKKYKLNSCQSGWKVSGNSCVAASCSALNKSYLTDIPINKICTKVTEGGLTCYKDCQAVACNGYSLNCDTFSVANSASKTTCPDCDKANANCSPKLCKVGSCQDGYKIADNGTTCVALDDTCPNGYFKSCETGTQGDPKYTEKGTACYQCKPKPAENMKVVVNFSRSCPSGFSFDFTPQGGSTVQCTTSYCYEYETPGYPYAPDGMHSNETESVVTVGTKINLSSIPSVVSGIKSVSKNETYSISGTTYSFNVNDRATVTAGAGQNTTTGLGAYDFWTLQCKSAAELCLEEGYKLQADYPKPTASNETVIPSTMLANFMKNVFELKSAMATSLDQGCPAGMKTSCRQNCTSTCKAYHCCGETVDNTLLPFDDNKLDNNEAEDWVDYHDDPVITYEFIVTETCPYDSNYVKGYWTEKSSGTGGGSTGSGCNGTIRYCQNIEYCCPDGGSTPCDPGYGSRSLNCLAQEAGPLPAN